MVDVSDNFNRSDGGLGANWTTSPSFSAPTIVSNECTGPSSANGAAYWSADNFENNQHAQITISNNVDDEEGVLLRHQGAASSFYGIIAEFGNQQAKVYRYDNGTRTELGATGGGSAVWVDGDTLYAEITGTSIVVKRNGGTIGSPITDSTYSSGKPGIIITDSQDRIDDFSAGPVAGLDGVLASNGVATAAFVGAANADGVLSSAGVAVGLFDSSGVLQADGIATALFVGSLLQDGVLSVAGVATATFNSGILDTAFEAAGVATVSFVAEQVLVDGVFSMAGVGEMLMVGALGLRWTPDDALTANWTEEEELL